MRLIPLLAASVLAACMQQQPPSDAAASPQAAGGCLAAGDGRFEAALRGAIEADLDWLDAQMQCDGDLRPDGGGLRITLAGPLDADRQVRFIIGIDLADTDDGPAQVLPTNLTVLVENEALLFATRGNDRCAVEDLARIVIGQGIERVSARGYCLGPASDLNGEQRVLVPTFSFTALARTTLPDEEGG